VTQRILHSCAILTPPTNVTPPILRLKCSVRFTQLCNTTTITNTSTHTTKNNNKIEAPSGLQISNTSESPLSSFKRLSNLDRLRAVQHQYHWLPISIRIEYKVLLTVLKAQMGWHLNISLMPFDFRPLPHSFVLYAPWTGGSSLSLELGQLWLNLDPFRLLALPLGIAFHHQLMLHSYHPIFLLPYHLLKLISFLGANRTKSAVVGPRMLRGAI